MLWGCFSSAGTWHLIKTGIVDGQENSQETNMLRNRSIFSAELLTDSTLKVNLTLRWAKSSKSCSSI